MKAYASAVNYGLRLSFIFPSRKETLMRTPALDDLKMGQVPLRWFCGGYFLAGDRLGPDDPNAGELERGQRLVAEPIRLAQRNDETENLDGAGVVGFDGQADDLETGAPAAVGPRHAAHDEGLMSHGSGIKQACHRLPLEDRPMLEQIPSGHIGAPQAADAGAGQPQEMGRRVASLCNEDPGQELADTVQPNLAAQGRATLLADRFPVTKEMTRARMSNFRRRGDIVHHSQSSHPISPCRPHSSDFCVIPAPPNSPCRRRAKKGNLMCQAVDNELHCNMAFC